MSYSSTFTDPNLVESYQEAGERVKEQVDLRLLITRLMQNLAWFGREDGHQHTYPNFPVTDGDGHQIIIPGRDAPNMDHDLAGAWYCPLGFGFGP